MLVVAPSGGGGMAEKGGRGWSQICLRTRRKEHDCAAARNDLNGLLAISCSRRRGWGGLQKEAAQVGSRLTRRVSICRSDAKTKFVKRQVQAAKEQCHVSVPPRAQVATDGASGQSWPPIKTARDRTSPQEKEGASSRWHYGPSRRLCQCSCMIDFPGCGRGRGGTAARPWKASPAQSQPSQSVRQPASRRYGVHTAESAVVRDTN